MELHCSINIPQLLFLNEQPSPRTPGPKVSNAEELPIKTTKENRQMQRFTFQLVWTRFSIPIGIINTQLCLAGQFNTKGKKMPGLEYTLGSVQVRDPNANQVVGAAGWACCRSWSPCRIYEILSRVKGSRYGDIWSIEAVTDLTIDFASWHWLMSGDWVYCGEIERERLRLVPRWCLSLSIPWAVAWLASFGPLRRRALINQLLTCG